MSHNSQYETHDPMANLHIHQDPNPQQPAPEEEPVIITATNVRLSDLPISYEDIKNAVLEMALKIQREDQGVVNPPEIQMVEAERQQL